MQLRSSQRFRDFECENVKSIANTVTLSLQKLGELGRRIKNQQSALRDDGEISYLHVTLYLSPRLPLWESSRAYCGCDTALRPRCAFVHSGGRFCATR